MRKACFFIIFQFILPFPGMAEDRAISVNGEVWIVRGGEKLKVMEEMEVMPDEILCTEEESSVVLILKDGSEVEVKPSTCMVLEETEESPAIFLFLGRIRNVISSLTRLTERYEVHTFTAVAGVRGTVFSVTSAEDGATVFEVEEGEVEVEVEDGSVVLREREGGEVSEDGKFSRRRPFLSEEERMEWLKKRVLTPEKRDNLVKELVRKREMFRERVEVHFDDLRKLLDEFENLPEGERRREGLAYSIEEIRRKMRRELALLKGSDSFIREFTGEYPEDIRKITKKVRSFFEGRRETLRAVRRLVRVSEARKRWNALPENVRKELIKSYRRWMMMSPEERALILEHWKRFRSMPSEKKREIIENYRKFRKLPQVEKERIRNAYKRWKALPAEKRKRILENYRKFKHLPPEKRKRILERFRERHHER